MYLEQTLHVTFRTSNQANGDGSRIKWEKQVSPQVLEFINRWINLQDRSNMILLADPGHPDFLILNRGSENGWAIANHAISLNRLNDISSLNDYLRYINANLEPGGCLIGRLETSYMRKVRLFDRYAAPLNKIIYFFDYLLYRFWPKLPFLRHIQYALFDKKNRAIPEMEVLGRLYYCGFSLQETLEADGYFYFVVKKVKPPEYNLKPDCGPLIRLWRNGKGGKTIQVYKFRTMFSYAEFLQQHVYERNGLEKGGKMKKDPRLNAAGFVLRKYWLDELPMLWNLLKGDIKLVGVRPISFQYLSLYPPDIQEFRKNFKPGLIPPFYADLPETFEEIVQSEMRYLEAYDRSPFLTDLRYFVKAVFNIFFRSASSK